VKTLVFDYGLKRKQLLSFA